MDTSVIDGVDTAVESTERNATHGMPSLEVRMLGPLSICRHEVTLALPPSRKARALFAYLSLASRAVARSRLCELLWDEPSDPRGELRWCLSKIRGLVDEPGRRRLETKGDTVALDLTDCFVDAVEVAGAKDLTAMAPERLRALATLVAGDFLSGLEIDGSPAFNAWLTAQRRRFRGHHVALLEHLARSVADSEAFACLDEWLQLAPYDPRVHELLLDLLARQGRIREAEEHLAAAIRSFEAEGLDATPLHDAWRSARACSVKPAAGGSRDDDGTVASRRASIAVMPFVDRSDAAPGVRGGPADAFAHDLITRLAKLRSLFVIAQGSVFALHERRVGLQEAARMLNVDYVVGGSVRRQGRRLTVTVELIETRTARIVWAEVFDRTFDDSFLVLDEMGNSIVAAIASEIETVECNRAVLTPPNSLDAWGAHHRGLWHVYRFNKADNALAQQFFQMAVALDPTFARAYAGLSFTHFQNAFQGWAERMPEIERAFAAAGQSLMADERDPAAHWALGRAYWLKGHHEQCIVELQQAIGLSPNFALGHYTLAFVHSQAGDAGAAISSSDHSRLLSPFDPLLFGMLGARAMALVRLGRFAEAAEWGLKAAGRPNAHAHILAIAAFSLALADRLDEGHAQLASIHKALPRYRVDDFLTAMQFAPDGERLFREGAKRLIKHSP